MRHDSVSERSIEYVLADGRESKKSRTYPVSFSARHATRISDAFQRVHALNHRSEVYASARQIQIRLRLIESSLGRSAGSYPKDPGRGCARCLKFGSRRGERTSRNLVAPTREATNFFRKVCLSPSSGRTWAPVGTLWSYCNEYVTMISE